MKAFRSGAKIAEKAKLRSDNALIWVDLEMTGLDPSKHVILEWATVVTTGNLEIVAQSDSVVVSHPQPVLDAMNDWCVAAHGRSGLTEAVLQSETTLAQCERSMVDLVEQHVSGTQWVLAGNSIGMDKAFLQQYAPEFWSKLHYRIVDVSSIAELRRRWYGTDVPHKTPKDHRALSDILTSIDILQHYKSTIFR